MIFLKFVRQQDWKYALPCILLLSFFFGFLTPDWLDSYIYHHNYLAWQLGFATGFLVCYSLKFAGKYNNLFIDQLKLFVYFVFFTIVLLFPGTDLEIFTCQFFPWILFYLYFYSFLIFYRKEMEEQGKPVKNFHLLSIIIVQTFFVLMVILWAITQKVEAEKQKILALEEQKKTAIAQQKTKELEKRALDSTLKELDYKYQAEREKANAEKYKQLYEEALKRKR